jgi:hypothetical protein
MLYIDQRSIDSGTRAKYWRIFADTTEELRREFPDSAIFHEGQPNEHVTVSTTKKNAVAHRATGITERDLVALIRAKRSGTHVPVTPDPEPETDLGEDHFDYDDASGD